MTDSAIFTDQNVIAGSVPSWHVVPDPATNRVFTSDANGNSLGNVPNTSYDVENRLRSGVPPGSPFEYSYAPGNKRVWRDVWVNSSLSIDEVTFWSVSGQKLATYQLTVYGSPSQMYAWHTLRVV